MNLTLKTIRDYAKIIKNEYVAHFSEEIDSPIMIPLLKLSMQSNILLFVSCQSRSSIAESC